MSSSPLHRSFWPAFQRRWAAVLCEQTEGLNAWTENMTQALRCGILEVPNSAEAHAALAQLNVRVSRLESARLASGDEFLDEMTRALFVNYGAAILNAPTHFDLAPNDAEVVLSYDEVTLALHDLGDWLRHLKMMPRRIFVLEDFDSQILGRALGLQLDVEVATAEGDGFTHSKSLIVSADNRILMASPLRTVFPTQVLYSFNLHREGGVIVPDVSSMSHINLALPWHEERPSTRKIPNIVERIGNTPVPSSSPQWPTRLEFFRARRQLLTAGNSTYARASMLPETL